MDYVVDICLQVQNFYADLRMTYRREPKHALLLLSKEPWDIRALGGMILKDFINYGQGRYRLFSGIAMAR